MNVYITDGTEQGFYTAVFDAYPDKNCIITSSKNLQLTFDSNIIHVKTDDEKSKRVLKKLRLYDKQGENEISLILRLGSDEKEQIAFEYLKRIIALKAHAREHLNEPAVISARDAYKKVTTEAHHFKGFLRFMEGTNGVYYAPFEPDNNILELIVPHFTARLKNQPFVIHDVKRRIAALYNTKECVITTTDEKVSVNLSKYEQAFQNLWKEYYNSVNVSQRPHEKQMKGYMPVRYWKYMPEKN